MIVRTAKGGWKVLVSTAVGEGGVATATWRLSLVGAEREPTAWRVSGLVVGVHDPSARRRGDVVADPQCSALDGQACFWRPVGADEAIGVLAAWVEGGGSAAARVLAGLCGASS
ncbi:MAG: hypothetical protein ACP5PM_09900 [Acidimicrobiales bacterium]